MRIDRQTEEHYIDRQPERRRQKRAVKYKKQKDKNLTKTAHNDDRQTDRQKKILEDKSRNTDF
jgi:hypothetical protein